MGSDDGLKKKLEYLSLVSKVCTELESHTGTGDKVLAEFITELGRSSETVEEFDARLKENGAEMPDYFVRTLLTIIHVILPPKPKMEKEKDRENATGKTKFKALAIADDRDRAKELQKEIESEAKQNKPANRDRRDRRRGHRYDGDERRDYRRGKGRDRESDRDVERERDRDTWRDMYDRRRRDGYEEEEHGRENDEGKVRRDSRYGYEEDERGRGENGEAKGRRDSRHGESGEPELYMVYKGRVSRVMDTGCFVQLDDLRGKEGLVHVSQMATRRITNAKDVVKRDQEVYVKVISVSGNKLSLTMREGLNCKNFECLSGKKLSKDCIGCFDLASGNENQRFVKAKSKNDFVVDDVLALGSGGIRIGFDIGGGSGSFAARMADRNVLLNFLTPYYCHLRHNYYNLGQN